MMPKLLRLADVETDDPLLAPNDADMQRLALLGYGLLTMEILYRMPDHRSVLNTFLWQLHDVTPHFPNMNRFLTFWKTTIDGPLHSVRYTHEHRLVSGGIQVQTHVLTMQ